MNRRHRLFRFRSWVGQWFPWKSRRPAIFPLRPEESTPVGNRSPKPPVPFLGNPLPGLGWTIRCGERDGVFPRESCRFSCSARGYGSGSLCCRVGWRRRPSPESASLRRQWESRRFRRGSAEWQAVSSTVPSPHGHSRADRRNQSKRKACPVRHREWGWQDCPRREIFQFPLWGHFSSKSLFPIFRPAPRSPNGSSRTR